MEINMRTNRWTFVVEFIAALILMASNGACADQSNKTMPEGLRTTIGKLYPEMRIVESKDIDSRSCGNFVGDHPGWVANDFNNDGIRDYATLLLHTHTKDRKKFNGQDYTVHDFILVALLNQKNKQFQQIILHKFEGLLPAIKGIKPYTRGVAYNLNTHSNIELPHPGFMFYSCEQFAWVFYWDGKQFVSVAISQ